MLGAGLLSSHAAAAADNPGAFEPPYEPTTVTLQGVVGSQRWYGAPNYDGYDHRHDTVDTITLLFLDRPISVAGTPGRTDGYSNLWTLQLDGDAICRLRHLTGRRVRLVGSLFEAIDAEQRTPVFLVVRRFTVLPGRRQSDPGRLGAGRRVLSDADGPNPYLELPRRRPVETPRER
jgi:hypothetical protein